MQVILQGSLRHFPAGELISFVCAHARGGTLDLESTGRKTRVFLDGGRIVWAESSRGSDITEMVLETFGWSAGNFTLLERVVLPDGVTPLALEIAPLLEEAARRAEASQFPGSTLFKVIENPVQDISLTGDEFKLLFKIGVGRTFAELSVDWPQRDLTAMLRKLQQGGLVTVQGAPGAPAPVASGELRKKTTMSRRTTMVGSLTPEGVSDVYPLLDPEQTIGRDRKNTITIPDASVSSRHARIERTGEGFVIEDLQSRNGTFVNGEPVTSRRLLADADTIRLGKVILTFNLAKENRAGDNTEPEFRLG